MKYRKKPVVIEAVQWTHGEDQVEDLMAWCPDLDYDETLSGPPDPETGDDWGLLQVCTLEGDMEVTPRDWIIKGIAGEAYAVKPGIFAATYEAVES